jgi:cytochrome c553
LVYFNPNSSGATEMNITFYAKLASAALLLIGTSLCSAAGSPEEGKKKFYTCEGCHSIPGYTNTYPTYHVPRIGGQHADYVESALEAYRSDERKHGSMKGNSDNLTKEDMEDIAAYVSKFRGMNSSLPVTGDPKAGAEKAAMCASCHGEDGNSENPAFPRLAGQYESYLIKALSEYKSGERANPMMIGFAATLSQDDIRNVSAFYASQKKGLTIPND